MALRRLSFLALTAWLIVPGTSPAQAADAAEALAARNPFFADLRRRDPKTFEAAVEIVAAAERAKGLAPEIDAPPPTESVGRVMQNDAGADLAKGNADLLWLYNASPEGMNDLISLLKSAGQKPKP